MGNVYTSMKGGVEIIITNFQKNIPVNSKKIEKTILNVLSCEGINPAGQWRVEISVCFVGDSKIKDLNKKYSGRNNATDVLAFDIANPSDSKRLFADIIVSIDTAMRNSKLFNTSLEYELKLYIIHGILHLLGYDDHSQEQRKLMRMKEERYVNT